MYQVSIYNNNVETIIHYPSSDTDDPHLNKLQLSEGLSTVDSLSFPIYPNNPGYDLIFELTSRIKVIDLRDNSIRFTGRILDTNNKMEQSGSVYKEVVCEGALSFLNDTKQRNNTFATLDVQTFLAQILNIHNSKVGNDKKIFLGVTDIPGTVIHTCEYKTTLAELLAIREINGGEIRVREVNGLLYLDWLKNINPNVVEVSLGNNMKDMVLKKDVASLGTRIIPLGANNLTIESVNGGLDYIDDIPSKNSYGLIEKTVEYKEIKDAYTLLYTCLLDIKNHTQPLYILSSNALDLSYITGIKAEQFTIGTSLHIINPIIAIDDIYNVIQISVDLLKPYDPTLTIANMPVKLTSDISDLRKTTIQDDGVYNNVQIGRSFGIRVVRSDNNVVTTMNATEGISIQNTNKKVFYVDLDGNIVCNDITANNMKAEGGTFNDIKANRGEFDDITANRGTYNDINAKRGTFEDITVTRGTFTDITAKGGTFDQIKATGGEFNQIKATGGIVIVDGATSCTINAGGIKMVGPSGEEANIKIIDDVNNLGVFIPNALIVNEKFSVIKDSDFAGMASFDGGITYEGEDLLQVIDGRIEALVKTESLK